MIDLVKTHLTHPWGPPWTLETLGDPWRPLETCLKMTILGEIKNTYRDDVRSGWQDIGKYMTRNVCLQIKWRIRQGHFKSVLVYKAKEATTAKVVENWSSMHCNCNLPGIQCIPMWQKSVFTNSCENEDHGDQFLRRLRETSQSGCASSSTFKQKCSAHEIYKYDMPILGYVRQ